ncbi:OmpA family protein [Limimaricola pyoseonensis]|uniref:Outer membrane protein OmpA n=1 Tax=Limimaricola pyoseonensis TaxID=521013 RepID=A0A1G7DD08_9RHOB|nr:OmpA family protein [Limimaricola pyoseonensis]SDE48860.1 Outer membrane protein OmpA [Limimaricola pyoseonensis]
MPLARPAVCATALLFSLALGACTAPPAFDQEAGFGASGFGAATARNTAVQTGQAGALRLDLARRFEAEVDTVINFAFDSAALGPEAQATLRAQAHWIRQFPEVRFRVYGHTDLVGSAAYNKALGLRRAQAAVAYLIAQGIERSRLEAVASFGETQPLIVTEGRARANRRTVTEVSGFVANHPSVLNGKYAAVIFRDYVASAVPPSEVGSESTGATGNGNGGGEGGATPQ